MTSRKIVRSIAMGTALALASTSALVSTPAHAQFGGIVYDPSNYAQNVLTAARTLAAHKHVEVLLVDQREYFEYTPGILRAWVEPGMHWQLVNPKCRAKL